MRKQVRGIAVTFILAGAVLFFYFSNDNRGSNLPEMPDRPVLPVLMYHFFDDDYETGTMSIPPARFKEHLQALKAAGYTTISDLELARYNRGEGTLPLKPLLITSDDGYLNNYEKAFPLLQEEGMKATIYAIVNFRGRTPGIHQHFSWEQAAEMVESGLIAIQSHSFDSHIKIEGTSDSYLTGKLTLDGERETDEQYERRVRQDLQLSKQRIEEELNHEVVTFSYPYGKYTEQTEAWAQEAGYELTMSIKPGAYRLGASPWAIPRITVNGNWSGEKLVAEIRKAEQQVELDDFMIAIEGEWTILHQHTVRKGDRFYISLPAFAAVRGYEAQRADGHTWRVTTNSGSQTWQLADGKVEAEEAVYELAETTDWIVEDEVPYIWVPILGKVYDLADTSYTKYKEMEVIRFAF